MGLEVELVDFLKNFLFYFFNFLSLACSRGERTSIVQGDTEVRKLEPSLLASDVHSSTLS